VADGNKKEEGEQTKQKKATRQQENSMEHVT
jgi:hypothetical protein